MKYHFVGIGGQGMNSIAQYLKIQGHQVTGSDRSFDRRENMAVFNKLMMLGIELFPQNGASLDGSFDKVIISSAIEENNKDYLQALELGIPVVKRAVLLAEIFNSFNGVAVGGTSGKTTVAGMLTAILQELELKPTTFLGGALLGHNQPQLTGNLIMGDDKYMCIEADESDGTIIYYRPKVGLITNISKDHHEVADLIPIFQKFVHNIKDILVINGDCPNCAKLQFPGKIITFGFTDKCMIQAQDIQVQRGLIEFRVDQVKFKLKQWGRHNVENALAAIGVALAIGIKLEEISRGLEKFQGVKRRLELVGQGEGVTFFDDYAHNPQKIEASILALREHFRKLVIVLQCHGFGPTKFFWNELIDVFTNNCSTEDVIIFPKIYDAGGTTNRSISAQGLAAELTAKGMNAFYLADREEVQEFVKVILNPGDGVLVMGARDETLSSFVRELSRACE